MHSGRRLGGPDQSVTTWAPIVYKETFLSASERVGAFCVFLPTWYLCCHGSVLLGGEMVSRRSEDLRIVAWSMARV